VPGGETPPFLESAGWGCGKAPSDGSPKAWVKPKPMVKLDPELKEVINEARKYGLRPGKWGLTLSRRKR